MLTQRTSTTNNHQTSLNPPPHPKSIKHQRTICHHYLGIQITKDGPHPTLLQHRKSRHRANSSHLRKLYHKLKTQTTHFRIKHGRWTRRSSHDHTQKKLPTKGETLSTIPMLSTHRLQNPTSNVNTQYNSYKTNQPTQSIATRPGVLVH